jgi:hypothetical protein
MSDYPHSGKIGLASRRLAPPPSIVNVIRNAEQIAQSHSTESHVTGHSSRVNFRDNNASADVPVHHQQLHPVGLHCPLSRSVATCVSKRQRLQAECHERTKEQMSAFFSQRSLEAECLPADQARHGIQPLHPPTLRLFRSDRPPYLVHCITLHLPARTHLSLPQDVGAARARGEARDAVCAGPPHPAAVREAMRKGMMSRSGERVRGRERRPQYEQKERCSDRE